ncbi:WD repeat-containing protein 44 [Electrophorus electricus]|uniref:WD repeat-containing protein 44 n=1 Tax=Electrophorus electricus TaxID=8005 RepID=A0A4W4ERE0_ELEEL|nr:WD repeat-containing protein 44 [Electrophorus electricus]
MASDTSDAEEFYDAAEDVNFSPSPKVSPAKFILPQPKGLDESLAQEVAAGLAPSEPRHDDSLQIIDSIIEESQKGSVVDEELLRREDRCPLSSGEDETCETEGPGVLEGAQVPELSAAHDLPEAPPEDSAQELLQPPDIRPQEVRSQDIQEAAPDVAGEAQAVQEQCQPAPPPPDITSALGPPTAQLPERLAACTAESVEMPKTADILEQVPLADKLTELDMSGPSKPPRQFTVEPDIVASTKKIPPSRPPPPSGGPPRRPPPPVRPNVPPSKSQDVMRPTGLEVSAEAIEDPCGLVSPNSTVRCLTKELQHSLDLASATSGDKVVTAQENDAQASSPGIETAGPQRPRSNSGRELTDEEILASVMIKNLDTGEEIPLIQAEEKLPTGINPLTLHIMRRTKEYITNDAAQSDDDDKSQPALSDTDGGKLKQRTTQLKKFLGKSVKRAKHLAEEYGERAVNKVKSVRDEVFHTDQDDPSSSDDEGMPYTRPVKFKAAHSFKGPFDFDQIRVVQDLSGEHMGAVWTMKFSHCGRLLATAGQDNMVRIWVLKNAYDYFNNMRIKYNTEGRVSPSPSQESVCSSKSDTEAGLGAVLDDADLEDRNVPFRQVPFCKYKGHTADLLDLSWSKNYFLLSSSMDKTVRLWHISRRECLCCFQHIDFVTAIAFHPRDDRYFLSGSLDGKLRLWNIPDKKVALWNEVDGQTRLITAANFCQNGKYAVIGTYDGRCIFYDTERLKYHTQIHVRSTRGRNRVGRKITGIEPLPGENKILVTSNDSRIRLYDLRDLSLSMKYKGYVNSSSQIKASFSHDYSFIVSGSEDKYVYIWSTYHDLSKFSSVRRDRNDFWEGIKAHNAVVTSAIFAPHPGLIVPQEAGPEKTDNECKSDDTEGSETIPSGALKTDHTEVLLSADFTGAIKVFVNVKKY